MKNTRIKIPNKKGHILNATLVSAEESTPTKYAIFGHCFTCSGNLSTVRTISKTLAEKGFAVLRFDFTGLGLSEGEFRESHFSGNVSDILAVHAYMAEHYEAPCLLVGHSLGGAAVLAAAAQIDAIKAVVTIGAPATSTHVKHLFEHEAEGISGNQTKEVHIGGRPFTIDKKFVDDFDQTDLPTIIKGLKKPLLVMHAPFDKIVGIENAKSIFHHALHPKSFISLHQADHLLSNKADGVYVGNLIGAWISKYF